MLIEIRGLDCDAATYFHYLSYWYPYTIIEIEIPVVCKGTEKTIGPLLNAEFHACSSSCGHLELEET